MLARWLGIFFLSGSEAGSGKLLLASLERTQTAPDLRQRSHLLEVIVQVVERVADICVQHALLQLSDRNHEKEVSNGRLIASTEPLLCLELLVDGLQILLKLFGNKGVFVS